MSAIVKKNEPGHSKESAHHRDFAKRVLEAAIKSSSAKSPANPLFAPGRLYFSFDLVQAPRVVVRNGPVNISDAGSLATERSVIENVIHAMHTTSALRSPVPLPTTIGAPASSSPLDSMSDDDDIFENVGRACNVDVDVTQELVEPKPIHSLKQGVPTLPSITAGRSIGKPPKRRRDMHMEDESYLDYGMAGSQIQGAVGFSSTVVESDDSE